MRIRTICLLVLSRVVTTLRACTRHRTHIPASHRPELLHPRRPRPGAKRHDCHPHRAGSRHAHLRRQDHSAWMQRRMCHAFSSRPSSPDFAFSPGDKTQYADALLHATFPPDTTQAGHTLLGKPEIKPVTIAIPPGYGYILTSKKSGSPSPSSTLSFSRSRSSSRFRARMANSSSPSPTTPPTTPMATRRSAAPGERMASTLPPETPSCSDRISAPRPPSSKIATSSPHPAARGVLQRSAARSAHLFPH